MTLAEIKEAILDHWRENYPQTARAQNPEWLDRQAKARAEMSQAEMRPYLSQGMSSAAAWSEVAPSMLTRCPTKDQNK